MLRCGPSRLNLTSVDIAEFERRFKARHSGTRSSGVRLNPGPGRATSHSFVAAEQNAGQKRAISSSSQATVQAEGFDCTPTTHHALIDRTRSCIEAAQALTSFVERAQPPPPAQASPRRHIDSFYEDHPNACSEATQQPPSPTQLPELDGTADNTMLRSPIEVRCGFAVTEQSLPPIESHDQLATPRSRLPDQGPHLLSSARARRQNGRNRNGHILNNGLPPTTSEHPESSSSDANPSVPDLILPQDESMSTINPALDPGAPVFVPRTRFAAAISTSAEGGPAAVRSLQWSSVDSSHSSMGLRIRSSSERNSDFPSRLHVDRESSGSSVSTTYRRRNAENGPIPRRRSRTTEQNTDIPSGIAQLERHPLIRPPSTSTVHTSTARVSSRNLIPIHSPSLQLQRQDLELSHSLRTTDRRGSAHSQLSVHIESNHLRSVSPAALSNSRSTPNFHQPAISPGRIYSRGSSLSWSRSRNASANFGRVPSMVSAASGISGGGPVDRKSLNEGLDAAAEFLRMRNSPLDDLTERLSRLSTSKLSHEADTDLGDADRPTSFTIAMPIAPVFPSAVASDSADQSLADIVALSLALPPSSSLPTTPQALPSTPPAASSSVYSDRPAPTSHEGAAHCGSPPSCIKRKPVPSAKKTPKVSVYDDSKPPTRQPQTPAELRTSTRRGKARSEITVQQSPGVLKHVKISSPPAIPERHPHRNTYPPTSTTNAEAASTGASSALAAAPSSLPSEMDVPRTVGRRRAQQTSEQLENELDGHLPGLEADRRTWMSRQEDGSFDVTPPREGRYERYLS